MTAGPQVTGGGAPKGFDDPARKPAPVQPLTQERQQEMMAKAAVKPLPEPQDPRQTTQEAMAKQAAAKQETERLRGLVNVPQQGTPKRKLDLKAPVKVPTEARPGGAPKNIPAGVATERRDPPKPVTDAQMQAMGVPQKRVQFNPYSQTYTAGRPRQRPR